MKKQIIFIGLIVLATFFTSKVSAQTTEYSRFRFAVNGGFAHRILQNETNGYKSYEKNRENGFQCGLGVTYYFTELLGVGIKYSGHGFRKNEEYYSPPQNPNGSGSSRKAIKTTSVWRNYVYPTLSFRKFNSTKKVCFLGDVGIGYVSNVNEPKAVYDIWVNVENSEKISAWVGSVSFGVDIAPFGLQISFFQSKPVPRERMSGGSLLNEKLSIKGVDISVGLRF
jgi:hypothetical protein